MGSVNVDVKFLEHLADCLMLQKVIALAETNSEYAEQQDIIDQTQKQLREIVTEHTKKLKRSLAQKGTKVYDNHKEHTELKLSEYTGPITQKGSY